MTDKRKFDIRLSQRDFNMLERRARRCKISKSEYMRRLLNRCVPREAPPLDYYGMMNELKVIREDLDVLAQMAAAQDSSTQRLLTCSCIISVRPLRRLDWL